MKRMPRKSMVTLSLVPLALLTIPVALSHTTYAATPATPVRAVGMMVHHSTTIHHREPADSVTIDGIAQSAVPASPSVAWMVVLTKRPGWVLSGDPSGLQLTKLSYLAPFGATHGAELFQRYGTPEGPNFYDAEWLVDAQASSDPALQGVASFWASPNHGQATRQNVQSTSLLINGSTIQGDYWEAPRHIFVGSNPNGVERTFRAVDIADGALHIRLSTDTLSRSDFMGVIGHLTGGRAHPDLVAHLQAELDAAPSDYPH